MNLWEELFRMRDDQRERQRTGRNVVKFKDIEWEENRQGRMKWYLHPAIKDVVDWATMVYVQEIPPGSRTGKVRHQGGTAYYVWKGKGYTILNGKKYEWEKDDMIVLPILTYQGVEYQHFNTDPDNPAWLIAATPNVFDALGVDLGWEFEQLEDAPKYPPR